MHLWHAHGHYLISETPPAGALPMPANAVGEAPLFALVNDAQAPALQRLQDAGTLTAPAGGLWQLDQRLTEEGMPLPPPLEKAMQEERAYLLSTHLPDWQRLLSRPALLPQRGARIQLLALGDVGATFLLALALLQQGEVAEIGIFDMRAEVAERYAFELGQIAWANGDRPLPKVRILTEADLFQSADVFVFAASAYVPAPGQEAGDVRQAQYEKNSAIIAPYTRLAAQRAFPGLFVVLSDPVERLTAAAYRHAQAERPILRREQFVGFGLGVMAARGRYLAEQEKDFATYLTQGRAYGCHGAELILANDPRPGYYDDDLSRAMTERAANLNYVLRKIGFKPYLAPAVSSGAMTLLSLLRRESAYATAWIGGIPYGCRQRLGEDGQWLKESSELDKALSKRLQAGHQRLAATIAADAATES